MSKYLKCNICNSNNTKALFVRKDWRYGFPGEFPVVQWQKCGLVYTSHRPDRQEIIRYYPDYYEPYKPNGNKQKGKTLLGPYESLHRVLIKTQVHKENLKKKRVLEIGFANGEYPEFLEENSWGVYGVDINPVAVEQAQDRNIKAFFGESLKCKFF